LDKDAISLLLLPKEHAALFVWQWLTVIL